QLEPTGAAAAAGRAVHEPRDVELHVQPAALAGIRERDAARQDPRVERDALARPRGRRRARERERAVDVADAVAGEVELPEIGSERLARREAEGGRLALREREPLRAEAVAEGGGAVAARARDRRPGRREVAHALDRVAAGVRDDERVARARARERAAASDCRGSRRGG